MPCLSPNIAVDFVVGALPNVPAKEVEAHMAKCHECRQLIVAIARAEDLRDTDIDPWPRQPLEGAGFESQGQAPRVASSSLPLPGKRSADQQPIFELMRGQSIGRYTLLYPLGEGGMGSVYAAFDPKLDRRVALKFLHTDLRGQGNEEHRKRLVHEARALARLSHPNVVSIYDVVQSEGSVFLSMELIEGTNARVWRELGNRSSEEILGIYRNALSALMAAHEQGIIHRDFKPDNLMVGADGVARVTDFGLARTVMPSPDSAGSEARTTVGDASLKQWERLTQEGLVLGTPRYMAPEQFQGISDERSDQFSFCLSLYEALYGHYPLGTKTPRDLDSGRQISEQLIFPITKNKVPEALRRIILRGMSPIPGGRWQDTAELNYELSVAISSSGPRWRWIAMIAAGAGIAAGALFLAPPPPPDVSPNSDLRDYAQEIQGLEKQVAKDQVVQQKLHTAQDKIRDLQETIRDSERERAMLALLEEEAVLTAAAKKQFTAPRPLPVRSVERSVTTRLAEVLACYESEIQRDQQLIIQVRVGIQTDGTVQWVHRPYTGNPGASQCLERALKKITFPASDSATAASLVFSFFRLDSGLLTASMRSKTRSASLGKINADSKGRLLIDCAFDNPLCGL